MRILHISSAKTFGGGERHLVDLCRGLQQRGHEIYIALRPTNEWEDRLNFVPASNFLHGSIRNSFGMFNAKRIAGFIRANAIDVVHAHVARDYLAAGVACRIAKDTRFILTRHVVFPMKPFHRIALNNISAAIAVSSAVSDQLRQIFPVEKVKIIPNGLKTAIDNDAGEIAKDFRRLHSIPFDAQVIGTLGELKPLKGQRDFVLAAGEISKSHPETFFVVTGKDNTKGKAFRRELRRLAKVLGLSERIIWLDWLEDTRPFFAAVDVFVSPSRSESFGLAILEAMIHEKAIVSTMTDGAKEILSDHASLVPIGDPIALARAVTELLDDREMRLANGIELRRVACERFSIDQMIESTEALYNQILG